MNLAIQLAKATTGQTSPNPMVGAVVVKDNRLLGTGAHLKAGTPHAEVHALNMAADEAKGSTIYVTLEPCNHFGRTPPCTEKIIECGVKRVVIGSGDPDSLVAGKGVARLKEAGIEVLEGVKKQECLQLNEAYFHHRKTGKPFVTLKTATTLDGKIATKNDDSRWITGVESRAFVHQLRHEQDAILVGANTVIADDPELTTRLPEGNGIHPVRIILDSTLRTPITAKILNTTKAPTWIFTTDAKDPFKEAAFQEAGVHVYSTGSDPRVSIEQMLKILGSKGILSLLVEGGSEVNAAMLRGNHVNKFVAFLAPKLLGGVESPSSIGGEGPDKMAEAIPLHQVSWKQYGEDLCIIGYPTA
ncbi:bifunctional diaminohydroxyphosphoribosylaminopyrimidine deaminase/5-amino-6-(5-phosphoribosylamino)uracil reductase RibD [Shimazuella soli]|uniref:bifunctional diaminohydroxyphosphoribosylaminopyrimidine deaminase/5-amino-6-(5-phosphoribosylamino)uracil reductase RibD n=1 Tax=Shimazuella soli TaxID=1892854 RepID=UPI002107FF46|nr:bifunctional diaminohydroxyphosphoribosylaminopyrimidine deaminase/5-amino-6-(5-phosphoribosylamino)uracil reductase RibD [Shimazuella soli]